MGTSLEVGQKAPDFVLKDQTSNPVHFADRIGKKIIVLFFYPKDFTGGCTKEACGFRDSYTTFADAGAEVIGVDLNEFGEEARDLIQGALADHGVVLFRDQHLGNAGLVALGIPNAAAICTSGRGDRRIVERLAGHALRIEPRWRNAYVGRTEKGTTSDCSVSEVTALPG